MNYKNTYVEVGLHKERPKVSVIITTFNNEKHIVDAIESVLSQTYKNYELIIVDDGSYTEETENLCKKYTKHKNIRYYKKKNGGPGSARNLGIKKSNGTYISFLDADDMYHPEKLSIQLYEIEKLGDEYAAVLGCRAYFFENTPDVKTKYCPDIIDGHIDVEKFLKAELSINGTPGFLFKKNILVEVGGYDEDLCNNEDFLLTLKIFHKYKIKVLPKTVFYNRKRKESLTQADPIRALNGSILFIQKTRKMFPSIDDLAFNRYLQNATLSAGVKMIRQQKYAQGLWLLAKGHQITNEPISKKLNFACKVAKTLSPFSKKPKQLKSLKIA